MSFIATIIRTTFLALANLATDKVVSETTGVPHSICRMGLGRNGPNSIPDALHEVGGDIPLIRIWNDNLQYLGRNKRFHHRKVESGDLAEFTVDKTSEGFYNQGIDKQPTYMQLTAGNDAICIAFLTLVRPDKSECSWSGDWGKECGFDWYESNVVFGENGYMPACTWMDGNDNNDIWLRNLQIRMESFGNPPSSPVPSAGPYCDAPYHAWSHDPFSSIVLNATHPMIGGKRKGLGGSKHRRRHERTLGFDDQLVVSSHATHSAKGLCASDRSKGPDSVSLEEQVYCDMAAKIEWPLCNSTVPVNCYDVESHSLKRPGSKLAKRRYREITHWDG